MNTKTNKLPAGTLCLLCLLMWGCSGQAPAGLPSSAAETASPAQGQATVAPIEESPDPGALPAEPLRLADERYSHPGGIFSLLPPAGWAGTEDSASTEFRSPDGRSLVLVEVTATGIELDADAFQNFVAAREESQFSSFEDFASVSEEPQVPGQSVRITKSLVFEGEPHTVISSYQLAGQAVFAVDIWLPETPPQADLETVDLLIDSLRPNRTQAARLDPYSWMVDFQDFGSMFTMQVPASWTRKVTSGDFLNIHTFQSPDGTAFIENILYDDGAALSRADAGVFALTLIRDYYAQDVVVTGDRVQPDGSERLTWQSPGGEFSGISFFESRGTAFLMLTVLFSDDTEEIYFDVLDRAASSYQVK